MAELSCRQAELLEADVDMGRAGEADRMRLEVHLQGCESCAARSERLRSLSVVLRSEPVAVGVPNRSLVASAIMEAGAEEEARRGASLAPWLAAAAVLLAVAGSAIWLWSAGGPGTEAPVVERGEEEETEGPAEPAPEEPTPEPEQPAALAAAATPCSGVITHAGEDAQAYLVSSGDRCRLRLDRGELRVFVDPEAGADLVIATPSAQVRVVGTVFSVGVEDGYTAVVVYRGTVEVSRDEESVRVTGGHRVDVGPEPAETTVRAAERDALEPLEHLAREPEGEVERTTGRAEPDRTGTEPATGDEQAPPTEGEPAQPAGGEPGGADGPEETAREETTEAPVEDLRRLLRQGRPAEARRAASRRVDRPEYSRRRGELLTVIAESYAMERRWRDALDWYERVPTESPGTATAANALVAAANIALDRLRDPARAAQLYERYLRSFPRGALHEDAFIGRCRALSAAGRADDATSCARAYLATHPDGRFRDRAQRLTE